MSTKTHSAFDLDIRVRDRHVKSGALSEKDVEKFLAGLPDLADAAEPVSLAQPALAAEDDGADDDLDDLDDEDDDDLDVVAAAPPAPAPAPPAAAPALAVAPAPVAAPPASVAAAPAPVVVTPPTPPAPPSVAAPDAPPSVAAPDEALAADEALAPASEEPVMEAEEPADSAPASEEPS